MNYLIIGGVAGGATVAARLRRLDEEAGIILFERGGYISYANCGLPYYIGGVIAERSRLFLQTAESFSSRFRIDVRLRHEVTAIHPERKQVEVNNLLTGDSYTESYDKLALAPGALPIRPNLPGIAGKGIFSFRDVADTDAVRKYIEERKTRHATIAGGGFIGLEMAENLHKLGISVTIVERANQVMAPLDYSMASILHRHLREKQVELILEDGLEQFEETEQGITVCLRSGRRFDTGMVLLCIGVRPESRLAEEAGLRIGSLGGIAVNPYMQTSDPSVYALGDAVEVTHLVSGKPALIPLAGPANKQARIAADNMALGNTETYEGTAGNAIVSVFGLTVATVGANAGLLRREAIPYLSSYTHSASHAGYYPGSETLSVKILFAPGSGQLLGGQLIGSKGADKRVEMLAQVIRQKGSVRDLVRLEQAYAPPYSSVKDPVNVAGCVAENILTGKMCIIHWYELEAWKDKALLLDVRTPGEYHAGTLPGAINIPLDALRAHLTELPADKPLIVFCAVGQRGYLACRILTQSGFTDVRNLSGGYRTWSFNA
ncbi:MAG: FAD-dependent oxidoreductase, partial [Tannerellaceae bacterium]|nr:FAD-dependent oxidoreductase [Tannerellaceae bacterium]